MTDDVERPEPEPVPEPEAPESESPEDTPFSAPEIDKISEGDEGDDRSW